MTAHGQGRGFRITRAVGTVGKARVVAHVSGVVPGLYIASESVGEQALVLSAKS